MEYPKPTIEEILNNHNRKVKAAIQFVDIALECNVKREDIIRFVKDDCFYEHDGDEVLRFAIAYITYKLPLDDILDDYEFLLDSEGDEGLF